MPPSPSNVSNKVSSTPRRTMQPDKRGNLPKAAKCSKRFVNDPATRCTTEGNTLLGSFKCNPSYPQATEGCQIKKALHTYLASSVHKKNQSFSAQADTHDPMSSRLRKWRTMDNKQRAEQGTPFGNPYVLPSKTPVLSEPQVEDCITPLKSSSDETAKEEFNICSNLLFSPLSPKDDLASTPAAHLYDALVPSAKVSLDIPEATKLNASPLGSAAQMDTITTTATVPFQPKEEALMKCLSLPSAPPCHPQDQSEYLAPVIRKLRTFTAAVESAQGYKHGPLPQTSNTSDIRSRLQEFVVSYNGLYDESNDRYQPEVIFTPSPPAPTSRSHQTHLSGEIVSGGAIIYDGDGIQGKTITNNFMKRLNDECDVGVSKNTEVVNGQQSAVLRPSQLALSSLLGVVEDALGEEPSKPACRAKGRVGLSFKKSTKKAKAAMRRLVKRSFFSCFHQSECDVGEPLDEKKTKADNGIQNEDGAYVNMFLPHDNEFAKTLRKIAIMQKLINDTLAMKNNKVFQSPVKEIYEVL